MYAKNMMRKIWRFLWITVTFFVVLLLLLLFILSQLDLNQYKETIESQVSELTGRQLKIDGELQLDLSLQPSIRIEKVSFANAPWGKQTQMLSLDLLQLKIQLLPLLDKKLIVDQLLVEGVYVSVETNAEGKSNWLLEKFADDAPDSSVTEAVSEPFELPFLPVFMQVQLDTIHFYYADALEEMETNAVINKLQITHSANDDVMYLSANGAINQQPVELTGEAGFLNDVTTQNLADQGIKLKAKLNALGSRISVNGKVEQPLIAEGVNATLTLEANDLDKTFTSATGESIYQYLPETEQPLSLKVSARLTDISSGYELSEIKLKLADTDISGKLSYADMSDRPKIVADLHSERFNLDQLLIKQYEASEQSGNADKQLKNNNRQVNNSTTKVREEEVRKEKVRKEKAREEKAREGKVRKAKNNTIDLPDTVLPFDLLEALDADINLSIEQFQFDGFNPETIKLTASLRDGVLNIKQFDLDIKGAPVRGSLMIDGRSKKPRIKTTLNIDQLNLGLVAQRMQLEQYKSGVLQSKIKLETRGDNIKSLLMALKGKADIRLENVSLELPALVQQSQDSPDLGRSNTSHRAKEKKHSVNIKQFKIDFIGMNTPFTYKLDGDIDKQPLLLSGELDSLSSLFTNDALKLKLEFDAFKIDLKADGTIVNPLNVDRAQINLALDIPDPKESVRLIAQFIPGIKQNQVLASLPITMQGRLTATTDTIRVENMQIKAADNDLSGDVFVDFRGKIPSIEAKLESQLINLNELFPATKLEENENAKDVEKQAKDNSKDKSNSQPKKTKLFSDEPLPAFDAIESIDINFQYTLKKLISNEQVIDNISLNLILKDRVLKLEPLRIDFAKGTIETKLELDNVQNPRFQLHTTIAKLDYGRLMTILGMKEYATGKLDAEITLAGEGDSVSALMASLDGGIRITTVNGLLDSSSLKFLSKDIVSIIPFTDTSDRQKINCGVVQFDINNGIASTHSMVINTGAISALGTGDINLVNETLSLYVAPRTKRTSVIKLALVPVNITGPLSSPSVKPDIAGTTISTTKTATNITLVFATGGIWLLTEGLVNKLWEKAIDDTDYCKKALAGEKIVPPRITLDDEETEDDDLSDILDDDENSWM